MKVSMLPYDSGPAVWRKLIGNASVYPLLDKAIIVDFVIIGAGFAGFSAARRLRQLEPNSRIAVIEARGICEGSSGRNSGFMIDLPHNLGSKDYVGQVEKDRKQIELNREAIKFAAEIAEEYSLPSEAFDISGKVNAAATEAGVKHNADYAEHLDRLNEPYESLDEKQMYEISGSRYYLGGLATPGNGIIKPAMYFDALANGLHQNRVEIYENSPVLKFEKVGNVWKFFTSDGSVEAPKGILAVNGHVESFGYFRRRLMHINLYGSITRRLTSDEVKVLGGEPQWGFTPADAFGTTVRRISGTGGDRIIVRNGISWAPKRTVSDVQLEKVKKHHDNAFKRRYPNLAGVTLEYRWSGLLCLSRNAVPAFGELEPGLYSACCQNGLGVAQGTLHGKLIAQMVCGHSSSSLDIVMQKSPPEKLPPEPFASIGAFVATRWGEIKAGKER